MSRSRVLGLYGSERKACRHCLYASDDHGIVIDEEGVCNICNQVWECQASFGTGQHKGERKLANLVKEIKASKNPKNGFDCIVGVSGGVDSSYMLFWAKEIAGLSPLAFHYDNTWNTSVASSNIRRVTDTLQIPLKTYIVDNYEIDDIYRAFLRAGVAELDCSTDLAFAFLLRREARRAGVRFILEGHSFTEEGITPLSSNYFDGRYIRSIHRRFGSCRIESYPLMSMSRFMRSILFDRVKVVRPYWYMEYSKDRARVILKDLCGWENYKGHHLENRMTQFLHSIYLPRKFGIDTRKTLLSARLRRGYLQRWEAEASLGQEHLHEAGLEKHIMMRLGFSQDEWIGVMNSETHYWYEFPTYKKMFELLAPLFYLFSRLELVPTSFYMKYCR